MSKLAVLFLLLHAAASSILARVPRDGEDFAIALPSHNGQLHWQADGFKIVQSSAKPNGMEIGIRGRDTDDRLHFLGFLFVVSEGGTLTSAKCRDGALEPEKKENQTLKVLSTSQLRRQDNAPIELMTYTAQGAGRPIIYMVRGFVASGDLCGDLEVYSNTPVTPDEPSIKKVFGSYRLDPNYVPQFRDLFLYAQVLYRDQRYKEAAPIFEASLAKLANDKAHANLRRATIDQAGMAYGISGDTNKARALFDEAIAKDPDYPLYYYNLACADAQEKKLADARVHLQQAFQRKANVIPGEALPDPAKDDSFLPYRKNEDFWRFIQSLQK
jgi:tetratricopeptide (TPR) repeat protein